MVISILDDGVDHTHPDLRDNFVSQTYQSDISGVERKMKINNGWKIRKRVLSRKLSTK